MAWSNDYRLGYAAGYNTGLRKRWPKHRPPQPPNALVAELIAAARKLRDTADSFLATSDPNDSAVVVLAPDIDRLDAAMIAVSAWLLNREED